MGNFSAMHIESRECYLQAPLNQSIQFPICFHMYCGRPDGVSPFMTSILLAPFDTDPNAAFLLFLYIDDPKSLLMGAGRINTIPFYQTPIKYLL